jgi:polyhydroxyalkanoate synthase
MTEANNGKSPHQEAGNGNGSDPMELARAMAGIAEQSQRLVADFVARNQERLNDPDPLNVGRAFYEMTTRLMADPQKLIQAQMSLWQDYMNLWQSTARRMMARKPSR